MTSKQRFLAAINREKPDRLPVTSHHVQQYFLNKYMNGISRDEFFEYFGLDPINWIIFYKPDENRKEYFDPNVAENSADFRHVLSDNWIIEKENIALEPIRRDRYFLKTPEKTLSMVLDSNEQTSWVSEHLIKEKSDIDIIAKYVTHPLCDVEAVNKVAEEYGETGLVRSHVICFDIFGQPGCWQDACCLYGTEKMIMEVYDDPEWVHTFLKILQERKINYIRSTKGARFDILELGGGDASTTVISPKIFNEIVAPYDSVLIEEAHKAGQKIVYHTCGGMMPILEDIAAMKPDAMETFTPPAMGGDADLAEAKKRIGDKVCMIGGFDQYHYFLGCTPEETRAYVRKCFQEAGEGGGYILCPSDHFFDADLKLIEAYADEARKCVY